MSAKTDRRIEATVDLDAPPDQVWEALTDAQHLQRWFPLEARVQPGEGGKIFMSWGEGMGAECQIQAWDPSRHLRTSWFESTVDREAVLAVDYFLEGHGGGTTLRVVHSGFDEGQAWDEEYNGIRRGWHFELRSLRHYLRHHVGKPRHVVVVRQPIQGSFEAAWQRLWSPDGLLREGTLPPATEGEAFAFTTAAGDRFEGHVLTHEVPSDFSGVLETQDHGVFRLAIENCGGSREVWLWHSGWGPQAQDVGDREQRWKAMLAGLFG